jgi:hypothetical protein
MKKSELNKMIKEMIEEEIQSSGNSAFDNKISKILSQDKLWMILEDSLELWKTIKSKRDQNAFKHAAVKFDGTNFVPAGKNKTTSDSKKINSLLDMLAEVYKKFKKFESDKAADIANGQWGNIVIDGKRVFNILNDHGYFRKEVEEGINLYKLYSQKPKEAQYIEELSRNVDDAIEDIKEDADFLFNANNKWNASGKPLSYDTTKIDEYVDTLEKAYMNLAKSMPKLAKAIKEYQKAVNQLEDMLEDN